MYLSLFYEAKNLSALETTVNCELTNVYIWLCANRLSLNIDKSNYVCFILHKEIFKDLVFLIISLKESPVLSIWGS